MKNSILHIQIKTFLLLKSNVTITNLINASIQILINDIIILPLLLFITSFSYLSILRVITHRLKNI